MAGPDVLARTWFEHGLQHDFRIEAVYVFGSFARHAEHEGSDIDLLVIGKLPGRVFCGAGLQACVEARLKHVLSEFVLRQACPERRLCFDRLSGNGVEGLRTNESKGLAHRRFHKGAPV